MPGLTIGPANKWGLVFTGRARSDAPTSGATALLTESGSAAASGASGGFCAFYLDPAQGANTRVEAFCITNDTAPAANFTFDVLPVSGSSGTTATVAVTLGAAVSGSSIVFTAPSANTQNRSTVSFATPAAGFYVVRFTVSASTTANSSILLRANIAQR